MISTGGVGGVGGTGGAAQCEAVLESRLGIPGACSQCLCNQCYSELESCFNASCFPLFICATFYGCPCQ